MQLTIGFSPCPNDTFIFDALIHHKIDTEGLQFTPVLEDVETLNLWAIQGRLDITKLSYGVLPCVTDTYNLLDSGSALGKGVGPLLIANVACSMLNVAGQCIAIPGENTTAHLLFSLRYPDAKNKIFLRYDAIEDFVLQGKGAGVIIHENRFTYSDKGLLKITDLGQYWEQQTAVPIPLGGIVVKKSIARELQLKIGRLIKNSIEYAFTKYPVLNDYIKNNAQEMGEDVMRKHIELYVNNYSLHLGREGRSAVLKLIDIYEKMHTVTVNKENIFVG